MRRSFVAAVAAVLLAGLPAPAALADPAACPPGVADTTGTNPSYAQVATLLNAAAAKYDIPAAVLKGVAYQESVWRQYGANGKVLVSAAAADSVCGLGLMQITADDRADAQRLASEVDYNIDEGAKILAEKYLVGQTQPAGHGPDDRDVIENWFYALCLYNGCPNVADVEKRYAVPVAERIADPFRRVIAAIQPYMRPAGFTLPTDADPAYDFPAPFQAQYSPAQQFVFYDVTTKAVTSTVPKRTHHEDAPPVVAYPVAAYGPDGPRVTCTVCGGWRLAEDEGVTGRAHWTLSQATEGTRVTWAPGLGSGRYLVSAYVPSVGTDANPLGTATYRVGSLTVAVDQAARQDTWTVLADTTLTAGATVSLNDVATVAGNRIGADAVRFQRVPTLVLDAPSAVTYGSAIALTATLRHDSGVPANQPIKFYKRAVGATAWIYMGTRSTGSAGRVGIVTTPSSHTEYTARYVSPTPLMLDAASGNPRVAVRTLVRAALSRTSVPSGTRVTLSTSVAPSHAGQGVVLQRWKSGVGWVNSLTATLNGSSAASWTFAKTRGTYKYRVHKPADADHVASYGPALTLTVT